MLSYSLVSSSACLYFHFVALWKCVSQHIGVAAVVCACVFYVLGVFDCSLLIAFCSLLKKNLQDLKGIRVFRVSQYNISICFSKKWHFIALGEPLKKNLIYWDCTCPGCWEVLTDRNSVPSHLGHSACHTLSGDCLFPKLTVYTKFCGHSHSSLRVVSHSL